MIGVVKILDILTKQHLLEVNEDASPLIVDAQPNSKHVIL